MDATVFAFIVIALALGGLIGWLIGGRAASSSKEVVENLRLQLNEVIRERDETEAQQAILRLFKRRKRSGIETTKSSLPS